MWASLAIGERPLHIDWLVQEQYSRETMPNDRPHLAHAPQWSIDQIAINHHGVFVFGWFFLPGHEIKRLFLVLKSTDGDLVGRVILDASRPRHDVASAFPEQSEALESGFLGAGHLSRAPQVDDQLILSGLLSTGEEVSVEISPSIWQAQLTLPMGNKRKSAYQLWKYYLKQAGTLLANGKFMILREKLLRQLKNIPLRSLSPADAVGYLKQIKASAKGDIYFIIDHQLGGGANSYRQQQVLQWVESGGTVLVLTYNLAKLQPVLTVVTTEKQESFSLDADFDLLSALKITPLKLITYNTGVSFVGADQIPSLLLALKRHHKARLRLLIHDYFSVCPSHFLLNSEGRFCRIPDLQTCRECLPNTSHGFTSLFQGDVAMWRQLWGPLLQQADEIVAFSQSSVDLIRKAFEFWPDGPDWLQGRSIEIRPHTINYLTSESLKVVQTQELVIGVVGRLRFHKGSKLIQDLSRYIESQGGSERIVVIGDLEERVNPAIVRQTGPYQRENLGNEILKSGANVMLFPSICPETFSYVTNEIIHLGMPLACFDYGAPAERLQSYEKGLVLDSEDPRSVLNGMRQLFQKFYQAPPASES